MKQEEKQMRQYLRQIGRQLEVTGTLRERILSDLENDIRAGLLLSAAALVIFVLWSLLAGQLLPGMAGAKGDSAGGAKTQKRCGPESGRTGRCDSAGRRNPGLAEPGWYRPVSCGRRAEPVVLGRSGRGAAGGIRGVGICDCKNDEQKEIIYKSGIRKAKRSTLSWEDASFPLFGILLPTACREIRPQYTRHRRNRHGLQPDMAGTGDQCVENAFPAEQHILYPGYADNFNGAGRGHGGQVTGIDYHLLARRKIVFYNVAVKLRKNNALSGYLLHDKTFAAKKAGSKFFLEESGEFHTGL